MQVVVVVLLCIGAVRALTYTEVLESEWKAFKVEYSRSYTDDGEELLRKQIFKDNKELIDKHNAKYAAGEETYEMGVNQFTDWLQEEFESILLGSENGTSSELELDVESSDISELSLNESIPRFVDWRRVGAVTPVKNQGMYPTCWAFATTGVLEGRFFIKTGKLISLSEQNLIDCCRGPIRPYNREKALNCIIRMRGVETEYSYSYRGAAMRCHFRRSMIAARIHRIAKLPYANEKLLAWAVSRGPVSVAIDARLMKHYKRGVFNKSYCDAKNTYHAVLIVGYGTDVHNQDYWLVKNSWGKYWGENGYIRMSRNRMNQCGIASSAMYPIV